MIYLAWCFSFVVSWRIILAHPIYHSHISLSSCGMSTTNSFGIFPDQLSEVPTYSPRITLIGSIIIILSFLKPEHYCFGSIWFYPLFIRSDHIEIFLHSFICIGWRMLKNIIFCKRICPILCLLFNIHIPSKWWKIILFTYRIMKIE